MNRPFLYANASLLLRFLAASAAFTTLGDVFCFFFLNDDFGILRDMVRYALTAFREVAQHK
jgi:hypothetical protein